MAQNEYKMIRREDALAYGLSFPGTYQEAPFHDPNWQLVRIKGSRKAFLWTYEKDGHINLNVKTDPEWRNFWRNTYADYYGAAEPPVRCGVSHLSGLTEPLY